MDWFSIASALCERHERPTALFDRDGRVLLINRAMEGALGLSRFEVEGKSWVETCVPREARVHAQRWLSEAVRGAIQRHCTTAVTKSGVVLTVEFDFSLLGGGSSQALLASAIRVEQQQLWQLTGSGRQLEYEVATAEDFGALRRVSLGGAPLHMSRSARCFSVVHGLEQPCAHCPLRRDRNEPWPRYAVRASGVAGKDLEFEVTVAERLNEALARIRLCTLSEAVLTAMHQAKLRQLAERANLSLREHEIMLQLMTGRSIDEIAEVLGITPRTVKFHQANLLQKLGADSRVDMLRLVF